MATQSHFSTTAPHQLLSDRSHVQIVSGTPVNNAASLYLQGFAAFFVFCKTFYMVGCLFPIGRFFVLLHTDFLLIWIRTISTLLAKKFGLLLIQRLARFLRFDGLYRVPYSSVRNIFILSHFVLQLIEIMLRAAPAIL